MEIRTRLTLLFTLITATLLLAFASVIYYSAREDREEEFYSLLKKEALTKANLFFTAQVDTTTLQNIYHSNRQILNEVEVAIYNKDFKLLYHDAVDIDFVKETPEMIHAIFEKGEIQFYLQDWQVVGMPFNYGGTTYIITAAAYDQHGYNKLNNLLRNSVIAFVISMLFVYLGGYYFSRKAFQPVKEMIERVRKISATNLDLRLSNKGNADELDQLAGTFNEMLSRLENSFDAQKHFVSNISHELRTPLAAIIAELELATTGERTLPEYKSAVENALSDAKKLVRLSNSLLDLAKASYDPSEIAFKQIRIDEILLDARQQVQLANPHYKIDIHFSESSNEDEITLPGNEYLLKTAFANLFENGCKFSSNNQSSVSVYAEKKYVILKFSDKGVGISPHDLEKIFTPFYRGENKRVAEGNGIGLYLTKKIILLHKGKLVVESELGTGTIFTVEMQHN